MVDAFSNGGFRSGRGHVSGIKLLPPRGGDQSRRTRLEIDQDHRQALPKLSDKADMNLNIATFTEMSQKVQSESRPLGKCRGARLPLDFKFIDYLATPHRRAHS